jgi:hypothetical protein
MVEPLPSLFAAGHKVIAVLFFLWGSGSAAFESAGRPSREIPQGPNDARADGLVFNPPEGRPRLWRFIAFAPGC